MIQQIEEMLRGTEATPSDESKLLQLKVSLEEKLQKLKRLDGEVLDLVDSEAQIGAEIEQADTFKEKVYLAIINVEKHVKAAELASTAAGRSPGKLRTPSPHTTQVRLPKVSDLMGTSQSGQHFGTVSMLPWMRIPACLI